MLECIDRLAGAFIVGADVNVSAGEDTIAEVLAVSTAPTTHEGSNGYKRAAFVQCDVSKSPELQNLFQQAYVDTSPVSRLLVQEGKIWPH